MYIYPHINIYNFSIETFLKFQFEEVLPLIHKTHTLY